MLHLFSVGMFVATLVVVGWVAYTFCHAYATETGSFWARSLAAGKNSATIVWAKLVIIAGGLVAVIDKIADLAGDPSLATQIQQYLTPQAVGYFMIGIMVVNVWARVRTLGK
jgi:hypothetical protein